MANASILKKKLISFNFNKKSSNNNFIFNCANNSQGYVLENLTPVDICNFFIEPLKIFFASNSSIINSKIDELLKECSEDNWDCEDAKALSIRAVSNAKKFIPYIENIELPDVIPSPNSDIVYIWKKNNNMLSIIFNNDNQIIYILSKDSNVCSGYFEIGDIYIASKIVKDFLKNE